MKKRIINPYLTEEQIKGKHFSLLKKANQKKFKCFQGGCNSIAIESHILQKNGVLRYIAEDQHLMRLQKDFFSIKYGFERIGLNDIFVFKGFCNTHDHRIFSPIESNKFNLSDYKNQLLISYRGLLNEIRKKEILNEFFQSITQDEELSYYMNIGGLKMVINNQKLAIDDLTMFKNSFEDDLENNTKSCRFILKKIKPIPICTSSLFSFESNEQMFSKLGTIDFLKPLDTIFFNALPQSDCTFILIGTKNDCKHNCQLYIEKFSFMNENELLKEINDIIFRNIETWVCNETFFKSNIDLHLDYLRKFMSENVGEHGTNIGLDINIFD